MLFSLEEISTYFQPKLMWRALFCAITATLAVQRLNPNKSAKFVAFEVTYHHQWLFFEVGFFALVGAIGGVAGAAFNKFNPRVVACRKKSFLKRWPVTEVLLVCLLTCVIDFPFTLMRASNTEFLAMLFSDCSVRDAHTA